jgi:hypothetical protein
VGEVRQLTTALDVSGAIPLLLKPNTQFEAQLGMSPRARSPKALAPVRKEKTNALIFRSLRGVETAGKHTKALRRTSEPTKDGKITLESLLFSPSLYELRKRLNGAVPV